MNFDCKWKCPEAGRDRSLGRYCYLGRSRGRWSTVHNVKQIFIDFHLDGHKAFLWPNGQRTEKTPQTPIPPRVLSVKLAAGVVTKLEHLICRDESLSTAHTCKEKKVVQHTHSISCTAVVTKTWTFSTSSRKAKGYTDIIANGFCLSEITLTPVSNALVPRQQHVPKGLP